jgi:hypothetical protein
METIKYKNYLMLQSKTTNEAGFTFAGPAPNVIPPPTVISYQPSASAFYSATRKLAL